MEFLQLAASLVVPASIFVFWLLPLVAVGFSDRSTGMEKKLWMVLCFYLTWVGWMLHYLLAPLTPISNQHASNVQGSRQHHKIIYLLGVLGDLATRCKSYLAILLVITIPVYFLRSAALSLIAFNIDMMVLFLFATQKLYQSGEFSGHPFSSGQALMISGWISAGLYLASFLFLSLFYLVAGME